MIFNACREMYLRLYQKECIGGNSLLALNTSLDLANDFALGRVRQNPIRAWANVLKDKDHKEHKLKFKRQASGSLAG
ncbi:Sodium/hydrogen exchanger 1, related [Eimeria tenella]|uniref:Sodium/hydrogen exchanger 1, related n=1 Tax=Eimeria tenella TaxID=5802 RepID=U6KHC8_EIMTE|nr:Sodium/hydrogen exchanger 1, related [Eimeria tenella]CDJ37420.1 Sodium/hydrogen exchanger 1, related [Eimeria tenella]|eukprot:XP_013228258.1 Sodium/hydrogen exchanger 1, related [Eimeria tenella]